MLDARAKGNSAEEVVTSLKKKLDISEEDKNVFHIELEAVNVMKGTGLPVISEELNRLWDMESHELMAELGVTEKGLELSAVAKGVNRSKRAKMSQFKEGGGERTTRLMPSRTYGDEGIKEQESTSAESKLKALKWLKWMKEKDHIKLEGDITSFWKSIEFSAEEQEVFEMKVEAAGKLNIAGLALMREERDRLRIWRVTG